MDESVQPNIYEKRVEKLLFEIKRVKRRIKFYDMGFNAWDCLTKGSSSDSKKKSFQHRTKVMA